MLLFSQVELSLYSLMSGRGIKVFILFAIHIMPCQHYFCIKKIIKNQQSVCQSDTRVVLVILHIYIGCLFVYLFRFICLGKPVIDQEGQALKHGIGFIVFVYCWVVNSCVWQCRGLPRDEISAHAIPRIHCARRDHCSDLFLVCI